MICFSIEAKCPEKGQY